MDLRPAAPPTTSPLPTIPPSPIAAAQVWPVLSPTQQQILFATLVRACRSLLPPSLPTPAQIEEPNDE
jgi:hypothetical protein